MLKPYLTATSYFYYIIELSSAYQAITANLSKGGMKPFWKDYDAFKEEAIKLASKEEVLFEILSETDLYGGEGAECEEDFLIYSPYLNVPQISRNCISTGVVIMNPTGKKSGSKSGVKSGAQGRGPNYPIHAVTGKIKTDLDRFYNLDDIIFDVKLMLERKNHGIFVPDNILDYASPWYIETTNQTIAMEKFLRNCGLRGEKLQRIMVDMVDIIRDPNVEEAFIASAEMLVEFYEVDIHNSYLGRNLKVFAGLFTEMQNNTRVPRNCGYTAEEMVRILY